MAFVGDTSGAAKRSDDSRTSEHAAASKNVKSVQNDGRDVVDVWYAALKAYNGVVGFELAARAANVEGIIALGVEEMIKFHRFRHDEGKVDKLRRLFSGTLELLEQGSKQLAAAAAAAFPPAAAIGTAVSWMLTACREVSADYDEVELFFNDMNSFLQRLAILEKRLPNEKGYRNCLMEVFASILRLCGLATVFIKNGRFRKWITNLRQGDDTELGKARKDMDLKMDRLREATQFSIVGNVEDLKRMSDELNQNWKVHQQLLEHHTSLLQNMQAGQEEIKADIAKLLNALESAQKDVQTTRQAKTTGRPVGQSKAASASHIRNTLPPVNGEISEYHVLKETIVDGTCTWLFSQTEWLAWVGDGDKGSSDTSPKLLAITGDPGCGKSHIAAAIYDHLQQWVGDPERRLCATHFYFREQNPHLDNFRNAVITAINQVAEQNPALCELLNAQIMRDNVFVRYDDWWSLLHHLLKPCFGAETRYRLFLVLDGIDELNDAEGRELRQFWRDIIAANLCISLVVTSRPDNIGQTFENDLRTSAGFIRVTKELQTSDLAAIVRYHLGNLGSLKRFSPYVKQQISEGIEAIAPDLLYAHHILHHFNSIGREGAVLGQLNESLPLTLHGLYEAMLAVCIRRTVARHHEVVRVLIHWLSFSFRPLLLAEVVSLLRHVSDDGRFELDDIPEVISRFVRIGEPGRGSEVQTSEVEYLQTGSFAGRLYNDGILPVKFRHRAMRTFFCQASASPSSSDEVLNLLTTQSDAHRRIFLLAADMARPVQEGPGNIVHEGLARYATLFLPYHWQCIQPDEHSPGQRVEIMETLASVMLNHTGYASISVSADVDYERDFNDSFLRTLALWATEVSNDTKQKLSPEASAWWNRVAQNPASGLYELAKGQFERVYHYQLSGDYPIVTYYLTAREALIRSGFSHMLAARAIINFPSVQASEQIADATYDVLGLSGLFDDIPMSPPAYHSIASLLFVFGHYEPAQSTCRLAISSNQSPVETVMLLCLKSDTELHLGWTQEASQSIADCICRLEVDGVPQSSKRRAFVLKALIEARVGNAADAAMFFAHAKTYDKGTMTMDPILDEEVAVFWTAGDHTGLINVIRSWSSIERLNWLTRGYASSAMCRTRHLIFQEAAARAGAHDYIEEVYQDAIKRLEHFDAAAPLRWDLAEAVLLVRGDAERARHLLDEVLNSRSSGDPYKFTEEDPRLLLQRTVTLQSRVLCDLFVRSRDEAEKAQLLDAARGVMQRPLPLSVPKLYATALLHHDITIARMTIKMGPRGEFQRHLQNVIDACFDALDDTVLWNDGLSLIRLAQALTLLSRTLRDGSKLERAARVLLSAFFSNLDSTAQNSKDDQGEETGIDNGEVEQSSAGPASSFPDGDETYVAGDDERNSDYGGANTEQIDIVQGGETVQDSNGDQRDEDSADMGVLQNDNDSRAQDEGDLLRMPLVCEGNVCRPPTEFIQWAGRTLHWCVDCCNTGFCELCYSALQADKNGTAPFQGRRFCGRGHEHIKTPIEGWRGVRNGIMRIEGDQDVPFKEFLRKVREELCEEAWNEFWEG